MTSQRFSRDTAIPTSRLHPAKVKTRPCIRAARSESSWAVLKISGIHRSHKWKPRSDHKSAQIHLSLHRAPTQNAETAVCRLISVLSILLEYGHPSHCTHLVWRLLNLWSIGLPLNCLSMRSPPNTLSNTAKAKSSDQCPFPKRELIASLCQDAHLSDVPPFSLIIPSPSPQRTLWSHTTYRLYRRPHWVYGMLHLWLGCTRCYRTCCWSRPSQSAGISRIHLGNSCW